ncbi:hypothetical protein [Candidatus Uabimicrobium sp. HlEnr_7]|uniref:hypothetical protein n=1 Tax=Candidatus Uabimicrobium helgolandensis TaxID=3095367 RepID=UPI0035562FA7
MRNILIFMLFLNCLLQAQDLTTLALEKNDAKAITTLRKMGNNGLQMLLQKYHCLPTELKSQKRLFDVIDRVSGQKHAIFSGLYWYTDIQEAKKIAQKNNKPILLLQLLGRLDEEFC